MRAKNFLMVYGPEGLTDRRGCLSGGPVHTVQLRANASRCSAARRRGRRACEPGAHKLDHLLNSEAVRGQDRFGAALLRTAGEQFERADAVGLGHALAAALMRATHGRMTTE